MLISYSSLSWLAIAESQREQVYLNRELSDKMWVGVVSTPMDLVIFVKLI